MSTLICKYYLTMFASSSFSFFQLQKVLPPGHPDPDDLFVDNDELPDWHPDLSLLLVDNPIDPIYIFRYVEICK